jgi:hypothetical protein
MNQEEKEIMEQIHRIEQLDEPPSPDVAQKSANLGFKDNFSEYIKSFRSKWDNYHGIGGVFGQKGQSMQSVEIDDCTIDVKTEKLSEVLKNLEALGIQYSAVRPIKEK